MPLRLVLVVALTTGFAASAHAQPGAEPPRRSVSVSLLGGLSEIGPAGRLSVGFGTSTARTTGEGYFAGTADGLVLAEGDTAQSKYSAGFLLRQRLGRLDTPLQVNVAAGVGYGTSSETVTVTDPEEVARRRERGRPLGETDAWRGIFVPVEAEATYWVHPTIGLSAAAHVAVPLIAESSSRTSVETDRELNAWQTFALVGVRVGTGPR